ncbi:head GIN domain-containing protein [Microbacterium sp. NPDC056569]|uniref:head GIN domain-containing protein n=1 Tax=Microbacterium sp. NPDC056569 TaxID=3345867 RepID=UPI00366D5C96
MKENGCRGLSAVLIAASLVALSGCSLMIPAGPMASEERDIGDVSQVVLETSGDLVVSEGEPALTVHAPEGVLERLTSEVDGETLVLATTPGFTMGFGEVRYELTLPSLEMIELNGSGDVDATVSADGTVRLDIDGSGDVDWSGLAADRVEVRLSGSGDVTLAGSAGELSVELEGSGHVDAEELESQDAVVNLSGSGEVDVSASDSLAVDLSGSGRVTYSGDPSTDVRVSGSGDVERR